MRENETVQANTIGETEDFEFAALSEAVNYRRAIIREFGSYLRGEVLEVGSGIGQMTEALLACESITGVTAVEPDPRFHRVFEERLPEVRLVKGTSEGVVGRDFDNVVTVNVMEHIEDDLEEFSRQRRLLEKRQGTVCCLVPARPEIFAPLDEHFGHYRRYTKKSLRRVVEAAGFRVEKMFYFNLAGYFAWAIRFKVMKKMDFVADQVRLFDQRIFPWVHRVERGILRPPFGQSLIVIAKVK